MRRRPQLIDLASLSPQAAEVEANASGAAGYVVVAVLAAAGLAAGLGWLIVRVFA